MSALWVMGRLVIGELIHRIAAVTCCSNQGQRAGGKLCHSGSTTLTFWFACTSRSVWTFPLGQRISMASAISDPPRPKWTGSILCDLLLPPADTSLICVLPSEVTGEGF